MRLVRRHAGKAARAASTAAFTSAEVAVGNVPTTSVRLAGLRLSKSSRGGDHSPAIASRPRTGGRSKAMRHLRRDVWRDVWIRILRPRACREEEEPRMNTDGTRIGSED